MTYAKIKQSVEAAVKAAEAQREEVCDLLVKVVRPAGSFPTRPYLRLLSSVRPIFFQEPILLPPRPSGRVYARPFPESRHHDFEA